ncbi:MAG: Flp pilus assembly protein CpaB, partial [Planctomycetaceae bacterium]|nr:Flp pilus assembly protein CpaB [Planctomycetaceae bacterium]
MRGKSLLAFALAIGCGLVAMIGVQQVLKKQNGNPDADKVTVFVAATEILPGEPLDLNMLERRKFLKGSVPKEAVIDPKLLENRALTCKVMPGDIIRSDKLGAEGKTGASISIPNGMRVVSLPTNTTQAHSGMLQAGDRVDVMVSYRVQPPQGGGRDYPETKTILGYIQVFATDAVRDNHANAEGGKAAAMKNVSLLVTP